MRLTIAYSKKRNLVLINNATYQGETLSVRPIRQPLMYMLSTEESPHVTLILMSAYQYSMFMLSTEDSTHVTLILTGVFQCLSICYLLKIAHK